MVELFGVMASAGRPETVAELIDWSRRVTVPDGATLHWLLATPQVEDAPALLPPNWSRHTGVRGLTAQRNLALAQVPPSADYIFFFDDDALPREDFVVQTVAHFTEHPDHVAITGHLLRDGAIEKREVPLAVAIEELATSWSTELPTGAASWSPTRELYGCNFAIRWSALSALRFEERFPLYSWLEDLDFAAQARRLGTLAKLHTAIAVHRGVNSGGRTQHVRFGYSQIANPALMLTKGTLSAREALTKIGKPVVRNLVGLFIPGESAMRRDRVAGNWRAVRDLIVDRQPHPERIEQM